MTTARELTQYLGERATYKIGKLVILVDVEDARIVYGKPQFLIKPVAGSGGQWVETGLNFQDAAIKGTGVFCMGK